MSIKRNVIANYISQFYVVVIGIVMVPLYIRYMGAEAYGLIGFYAMLQAWFMLLDMGFTPTMARETACYRGGMTDALTLCRLLRTLEYVFVGVAMVGAGAMMAGAGIIANKWLKVQHLPLAEVKHAIMLMAVIVALRWICALYRGTINGFERLVWLGSFNVAVATIRFVCVIPFFMYVSTSPTGYFSYQLVIALIEVAALTAQTYRLLPRAESGGRMGWQWQPLRRVLKFSLTIAFTGSIWVMVTQTDKLVLSKMLPLTDYAYFTLAVLLAGGVMVISGPVSGALLPRLTKLNAEGNEAGLISLYRSATQLVGVIAIPAALVLAFFAEKVLWTWTGDMEIARKASPVLTLYAAGNGILALAAFPYYLQFAKGDLKLHLVGNALFVALFIPMLLWTTWKYGMIGAGFAWLISNLLPFVIWLPVVHQRFVRGLHLQWLRDLSGIICLTACAAAITNSLMKWPQGRLQVALVLCAVSLALLIISAAGSPWIRGKVSARLRMCLSG